MHLSSSEVARGLREEGNALFAKAGYSDSSAVRLARLQKAAEKYAESLASSSAPECSANAAMMTGPPLLLADDDRAKATKNMGMVAIKMRECCQASQLRSLACDAAKHFTLAAEFGRICMPAGWLDDCEQKAKEAAEAGARAVL
jgi:hypothetical protein